MLASSAGVMLAHKGRTLLSSSAVFVGVCAVTLMLGTGQSARKDLDRRMEALGTNVLMVQAGEFQAIGNRQMQVASFSTLVPGDAQHLLQEVPQLAAASGVAQDSRLVARGREKTLATVCGAEPSYFAMSRLALVAGRFFTTEENRAQARVAVLNGQACTDLRLGRSALGTSVRVEGILFHVIGVVRDSAGIEDQGQATVYVPLSTAMGRLFGRGYLDSIQVQARAGSNLEATMGRMIAVLRSAHRLPANRPNDFTIQDPAALLKAQHEMGAAFQALMAAVAGVSLLTGCAGIVAVMLLSVRERTGEIGLRRATGATRGDVALQFLAEAAALAATGGVAGALAGFAGTAAACLVSGWPLVWPWSGAALSLGLSVLLGLLSGLLPALRAAYLDPARALVSPG